MKIDKIVYFIVYRYAKSRGRHSTVAPRVPPPAHYLCFRCRKPGHWIQNCPTNGVSL